MNAKEFLEDKGIEFDSYIQGSVKVLLEEYAAEKLNEYKTREVQDKVLALSTGQILGYIKPFFIDAFINSNNEIILEPKNNIYFNLEGVHTKFDLDLKVIKWVSRPSYKGLSNTWQKRIRTSFNSYFGRFFEVSEIERIYTRLGNGVNSELCIKFLENNMNIALLS